MRRAAKKDANHQAVVKILRDAGCLVLDLGAVGNGCPDLLVKTFRGMTLLEVKDGKKPPSERKLTPDQVEFHRLWAGEDVKVVTSPEEALVAVGIELVRENW